MTHRFYSNYARVVISCWPDDVTKLITTFALPQATVITTDPYQLLSSKEINEAAEDSNGLVTEYLRNNVSWQQSLNNLGEKSQEIASDLSFLADIIETVIGKPKNQDLPLEEMNTRFDEIKSQEELPQEISHWLYSWREENLVPTMQKWQRTVVTQHAETTDKIIDQLKKNCQIDLSDLEKSELTNPTKTREELIADLKKFFPHSWPKGFNSESELIKLRALWAVGAARQRTFATDEKAKITCIRKTILSVAKEQGKVSAKIAKLLTKELSGLIEGMLSDYDAKLAKIEIMAQSERAELAIRRSDMLAKERLKVTAQAAPEL